MSSQKMYSYTVRKFFPGTNKIGVKIIYGSKDERRGRGRKDERRGRREGERTRERENEGSVDGKGLREDMEGRGLLMKQTGF